MSFSNNLKYNIAFLIKDNKLTQQKFGNSIGYSQNQISNWLNDNIKVPTEALVNISDKYNCSIDRLLFERLDDPMSQYNELARKSKSKKLIEPIKNEDSIDKDQIIRLLQDKIELLEKDLPGLILKTLEEPIDQIRDLHSEMSRRELKENLEQGLQDANKAHKRQSQNDD